MNGMLTNGLPDIFFTDDDAARLRPNADYAAFSNLRLADVQAAFGIALHMHQPTIPAGGGALHEAALISNLKHMMDHQGIGDNHNAPVFLHCYYRMGEIIPDLVARGRNPRVMLDYSGNLLWGIPQMGETAAVETLRRVTCDKKYFTYVEWLGTMWSHAVATSTPIPDLRLHIMAWRRHFAALFGEEAVRRVKGFSPPEMHLPIHPDQCYEYIKALKEAGYEWMLVQEHTIENVDGAGIRRPHLPHRLIAKNSSGETQEIVVLIKTQGSDTKLVAQMQPYAEAKGQVREAYAGIDLPRMVTQIGDGENGGVMMNEFPRDYPRAFEEVGRSGVVAMNGSEYLDHLKKAGARVQDFISVQPVAQHRVWHEIDGHYGPGAADAAIDRIRQRDQGFNLDRASWTSDRNWVAGYQGVLGPINALSAAFHARYDGKADVRSSDYQQALLYLLLSQTSCFRYWGEGAWTDYAKELCRRGMIFC